MSEGLDVFSKELKPCPFCGGEAVYKDLLADVIQCTSCPDTHIVLHSRPLGVWNDRPNLAEQRRANAVHGVKACPLCGSYGVLLDFQMREIFCPKCGLHHGLGILHSGPLQEIIDSWNRRYHDDDAD